MIVAAILFSAFIGIVVIFQLALAAGAPWGSAAMGGKYPGKLPPAMRVSALIQVLILALFASIVLSKSGIIWSEWHSFASAAIWFVVGFLALNIVLNTITRSKWERIIWAPIALVLFITSVIVAVG
ncbi:hypothetical protein [Paenibacillus sp. PL2-23]|uniref:hypothetical protein n=1 Tax=Paenibacillus sp. PL2-23 TaxID=2100729 RepID=UPI0030F5E946